jgi:hypothetical protein
MWELVCEAPPFTGPNAYAIGLQHIADPLPEFVPTITIPDGFEKWLRTLLEKEPHHRFQWATDAMTELHGLSKATPSPRRAQHQPAFDSVHATRILQGSGLGTFALRAPPTVGRVEPSRR